MVDKPRYEKMQLSFYIFTSTLDLDSETVWQKMDAKYSDTPFTVEHSGTREYRITMTQAPPWDDVFAARDRMVAVLREVEHDEQDEQDI